MTNFLTELREELLDGLERHERAPRWRRALPPRGRRGAGRAPRRIAALAVAAVAAIALAVQVADRAPDPEHGTTPPVSRLEGFHATAVAAADGSLWVTQYDLSELLRIDLQTGKVQSRVDVGGSPGGVIAAAGAVWVHDWERGRLLKVDAHTNQVVKTLTVGSSNGDVAFAAGAIWAIDERGQLVRVDPGTVAVTQRKALGAATTRPNTGSSGSTLAAAGDTLWIVAGDGHIAEVDARTGRILGRARGPALPVEKSRRASADDSGLWISSPARREVLHINAHTRQVTRFPLPGDPGPLAIVNHRIWIGTLHDTGTLTRVTVLDANGRMLGTISMPHRAVNIAPTPGSGAWITFGEDNTVSPSALRTPGP
jgi:streptogramin lyase